MTMDGSEIQEANWGNFRAKFNGKEPSVFQWFCYLLFCEEYKQPLGISRYENHAGIETDPITVGQDVVGWQAKFYEKGISTHKAELISSIDTAKARHPELTKIVFYLNQDFGQDKKKTDPAYKVEIENQAKSKGVSVVWKTASFFESPFVTKENVVIAKYFFSLGKSVFDLISELKRHTQSILNTIHSGIPFDEKELKIDRTGITEVFKETLKDGVPVILSGEGGVGKTAVIKDLYLAIGEKLPLFVFKATQFNNITNINSLLSHFGGFGIYDLATAYRDVVEKCIVIDSAEKLSEIEDKEVFNTFIN